MSEPLLALAVFAACAVEAVEALTVVLAVGITLGWRPTLRGVAGGLAALTVIVAVLGPALTVIPIGALRAVVGGLLLVFGLGWLRKAILRASGWKATHDEEAIFARQLDAATTAGAAGPADSYAFALSFKSVLLEGLEVAFIVVTAGASQHDVPVAAAAAAAAVVVVTIVGLAVRAPLARVPENTLKFAVGILLTSYGCFWAVEGAGGHWPGGDGALVGVVAFICVCAFAAVALLRKAKVDPRRPDAALVGSGARP